MKNTIISNYLKHQNTIINLFWRAIQIFGKQGVGFLIFLLGAKVLSPYEFGLYSYSLGFIYLLIMFSDFGISTAASKYVTEYNLTESIKGRSVLFNSSILTSLLSVFVITIFLLFGQRYLLNNYSLVLVILPLVFLIPMTSLFDGIYRGSRKFKLLALVSLFTGLVTVPIVYFLVKHYGINGLLISQDIYYLILFLGLVIFHRGWGFVFDLGVVKKILSYSVTFGLAVVGYYLYSRVDIMILGHYGYMKEIATYELLNKIFSIMLLPFTLLGQIVGPNFTELAALHNYEKIRSKFKSYSFFFLIVSTIFLIISIILLIIIVPNFFEMYNNTIFYSLLLPVTLIYSVQVYCSTINFGIIVSTGYAKLMVYISTWLGLLNLGSALIFLHFFGYLGVIYANLISTVIGVILLHWFFFSGISEKILKR